MGVNWNHGLMRWMPHRNAAGELYPLNHLHPFRFSLELERGAVTIAVAFAMHCFTKDAAMADPSADTYSDERETRAFCSDRYQLSKLLPALVRGLASSACQFAKADNYVVVETADQEGNARLYGVFFNVKKWKAEDGPCVLLTVQSAYPFSPSKPQPGQGKIRFTRLIELTLDGVKPQKPRR